MENVVEKNINDININKSNTEEKLNDINNNKIQNKYHNDGHITNDMINNEANLMISQEEENENI